MSEQLWYTWSDSGFGTTIGFRVRATSRGLMDVESERVRNLVKLMSYSLPQDTDLYLPLKEAPVCLAFLKAGSKDERILINKTYTGLDGLRRPGAYFSHLLTDLPPVVSPRPEGQIEFSAREAIELWGSTELWQDSEQSLPPGKRELEPITNDKLIKGYLSREEVAQVAQFFRYVLSAFLTLPTLGDWNRLYIAAPPDTVAALIWGLTHALPRTLKVMRRLTFSTFESNIENKAAPLIVGTCWLPQYSRSGPDAQQDLPAAYYQPNNSYGLAINCYQSNKATPFTPDPPEISKFVEFATRCFVDNSMSQLDEVLIEAEKKNTIEVAEFLQIYASFQELLSKEQIMSILRKLYLKAKTLIEKVTVILIQGKMPSAEMVQWEDFQLEAEMLQRENVYRSILRWMAQDPRWWQEQGKAVMDELCQLADAYAEQSLIVMRENFITAIKNSKEWRRDHGQAVSNQLGQWMRKLASNDPVSILNSFAEGLVNAVLVAEEDIAHTLLPLASNIAERVQQAIGKNDSTWTLFWAGALTSTTSTSTSVEVWTSLLQQLSLESLAFNVAYSQWWQQYCQAKLNKLRQRADMSHESNLTQAFSAFAKKAASNLYMALGNNDSSTAIFWASVLNTSSSPTSEPEAWAVLLQGLSQRGYTPAYQQWWEGRGKAALKEVRSLVDGTYKNTLLDQAFTVFMNKAVKELQAAIVGGEASVLPFWQDVLMVTAPYAVQPDVWMLLLHNLWNSNYTPTYLQWWQAQGETAAQQLRRLAESEPQGRFATDLSSFVLSVVNELHTAIVNEALQSGNEQQSKRITFLLGLLTTTASSTDPNGWPLLVQKLSQTRRLPGRISETYSWELRALLLQKWAGIATLRNNTLILREWLDVRWSELGKFFSLGLPEQWQRVAVMRLLSTPLDMPAQDVVSIVNLSASLFEEIIQQLMQTPSTQQLAINFFAILAQHRYPRSIPLLDAMITASGYQNEIAGRLFALVHLESDKDVVELLENHCKELLATRDLPSTLLSFIRAYFVHFDVGYLRTGPTRDLLQLLQRRNTIPMLRLPEDLQAAVELWGTIAEFIERPQMGRNTLRDLSHTIRNSSVLPQLASDAQQKLVHVLMPALVEQVSGEADLTRAIDNLGRVLMGSVVGAIGPDLLLLERMAAKAGELYGRERPPARLVPYIREVLGEAFYLPSPQKEEFIDRCFRGLLKDSDAKARDFFKNNPMLWPEEIFAEWKAYLKRSGNALLQVAYNRFREALRRGEMANIVAAYDPQLEMQLTADERTMLDLAQQFINAYTTDDAMAMVATSQAILGSPYRTQLIFTNAQSTRISAVQNWLLQQQAHPPVVVQARQGQLPNPPQTQPPAAPVPTSNDNYVVVVNGKGMITTGWLAWVVQLKSPYVKSRISHLQQQIGRLEQSIEPDRNAERQRKQDLKVKKRELNELEKLPSDSEGLRPIVLEELVDDVLIQMGIKQEMQQNSAGSQALDPTPDLPDLMKRLKLYLSVKSNDSEAERQIIEVLRIFRRRELFAAYLDKHEQRSLSDWLKGQRRHSESAITIDYERAGVKRPKGGIWPF